jgi:hydroxymethylpyrimidine pyrophosphatase-like HAD family hydrolase
MDNNNYDLLNKFISFNYKYFIKNKKIIKERQIDLDIFQTYIDFIIENKYFTSNMYKKQYIEVKKDNDIKNELRILRNMIGDTTDNFVLDFVKNKI